MSWATFFKTIPSIAAAVTAVVPFFTKKDTKTSSFADKELKQQSVQLEKQQKNLIEDVSLHTKQIEELQEALTKNINSLKEVSKSFDGFVSAMVTREKELQEILDGTSKNIQQVEETQKTIESRLSFLEQSNTNNKNIQIASIVLSTIALGLTLVAFFV